MRLVEVEMKSKSIEDLVTMCRTLAIRGLIFTCNPSSLIIRVGVPDSIFEGVEARGGISSDKDESRKVKEALEEMRYKVKEGINKDLNTLNYSAFIGKPRRLRRG